MLVCAGVCVCVCREERLCKCVAFPGGTGGAVWKADQIQFTGCDVGVLQGNHRSWADFFIDAYLTEGRGQMMSRCVCVCEGGEAAGAKMDGDS